VLAAWRRSGLSARAFAGSIGIDAQRLLWWRKRLEAGVDAPSATTPPATAELTFIPATIVPSGPAAAVRLRLSGGVCLEIGDAAAVSPAWVAAVVAELGKVVP